MKGHVKLVEEVEEERKEEVEEETGKEGKKDFHAAKDEMLSLLAGILKKNQLNEKVLVPDVWGYIRENKLAYPKGLYWEFKCDESPRHARSYSKGGQNTKEFTRMKDLSEWLIRMADHHEISDFRSRTWESDMYHP